MNYETKITQGTLVFLFFCALFWICGTLLNRPGLLEDFNQIMRQLPLWADGLPVDADGYEGRRYRK